MTAGAFRVRDLLWIIAAGPACWPLALQILNRRNAAFVITDDPAAHPGRPIPARRLAAPGRRQLSRPPGGGRGIAANLRAARLSAGLTQAQLASEAGLTRSFIGRIEQGRTTWIDPAGLQALAKILHVQVLWLTDSPPPRRPGRLRRVLLSPLACSDREFAFGCASFVAVFMLVAAAVSTQGWVDRAVPLALMAAALGVMTAILREPKGR